MNRDSRIFVAGHRGLVGSAILRNLREKGYNNFILKTRSELDLMDQQAVGAFFETEKPKYVFLAAARVGGIVANNTYPAEFIYQNLMIQCNVIDAAWRHGVKKLLFLGSSCIYPKLAPQPMKEEYLLSGYLEPTNEAYALAKISGLKMCAYYKKQYGANFISCMPTNLYGPNDNFDLQNSHVLPALMRKMHEAKVNGDSEVVIWGTGSPLREFLHVYDMADACVFLMENYDGLEFVNVGTGKEVSIRELAEIIRQAVGYEGKLVFDVSKPDGTPRKLLDVSRLKSLGWEARTELEEGIRQTYQWFLDHIGQIRKGQA